MAAVLKCGFLPAFSIEIGMLLKYIFTRIRFKVCYDWLVGHARYRQKQKTFIMENNGKENSDVQKTAQLEVYKSTFV